MTSEKGKGDKITLNIFVSFYFFTKKYSKYEKNIKLLKVCVYIYLCMSNYITSMQFYCVFNISQMKILPLFPKSTENVNLMT